eukprot:jgi/Bigna1/132000/aug1.16_g6708
MVDFSISLKRRRQEAVGVMRHNYQYRHRVGTSYGGSSGSYRADSDIGTRRTGRGDDSSSLDSTASATKTPALTSMPKKQPQNAAQMQDSRKDQGRRQNSADDGARDGSTGLMTGLEAFRSLFSRQQQQQQQQRQANKTNNYNDKSSGSSSSSTAGRKMEIENDTIISATTSRRRDDHHPQQHQGNNNNNNNNNWDGKQAGNRRSHPPGMGYRPAVSGILGTTTPPPREGHQQPALAGGRNSLFSLFYRRRGTVHERQAAADGDKSEDAAAEMSHDGKTRAEQQHSLLHVQKVSNGYRGGRGNKKRASVSSSSSSSSPSPFSTSMASSARSRASSSSSSSSRRRRLKNIGWDVIIEDYWRLHSLRRPIASYFLWNG